MKVISIRQPWAALIVNGYKDYEFRSWKTNYRGKILIHASSMIDKKHFGLLKELNLEYETGSIIGEVEIIDCIPITKEFEDKLIDNNPKVYGYYHGRTGYAWHVINAKKIKPISAKGKLSFWEYPL